MPKHKRHQNFTITNDIEGALNNNDQLFRFIAENSFAGILVVDERFRIIYCNNEARRIGGHPKKEIIGKDFRKFLCKSNKKLVQEKFLRRRKGEDLPSRYAVKIVRKDGEVRDVEVKSALIKQNSGRTYTLAQLIDITEKGKIEKERKRFEERLSALNTHAQCLNMAKSTEQIFKLTLDAAEESLGFEIASILMIEGKKLRLAAQRGYPEPFSLELSMEGKKGITVRAAKKAKSIYIPDVRKDKAYVNNVLAIRSEDNRALKKQETTRIKVLSELAVPIKIGNRTIGVLNVESKKIAGFDEDDRKLLEILASHAATATSNLRRQEQLKEISQKLSCLMRNATKVMNVTEMRQKLKVIAKTIKKLGWQRVVISLRDENLEGTDLVTAGLAKEEIKLLLQRKAPGKVWKKRLGQEFERFKIGEFYYLPWTDPWIREKVHGVPPEAPMDEVTTYAGVPSKRSVEEMINWHPQDMIYAPLRAPSGRIVGILSMDDPIDGRTPTKETLAPLALFLHQAAIVIENAQLIEDLREASEKLEQKVEVRTQELKKSQEKLLKAQRLAVIGELASMVGHDLRNPLTSIAGATYFVKKRSNSSDAKMAEMLKLIEKNVEYSNKIINDLLEYSKEVKLDLTERNPKTIIEETLYLVEKPKTIRIINLTESEPKIAVDPEKLKRAFVNLIKNAFDAMSRDGTLTISSRRNEANVEFKFSDTGVGMKKKTLEKLWVPLFTTKAKGMGFGLPICKRIIEAHKGSINVKSRFGKGTTFTVILPIKQETEKGGEEIWMKLPESLLLTTTKT